MTEADVEHVLLETNFVVGWAAPSHQRRLDALRLVEKAEVGELSLWIPAISILEARKVLQQDRFRPKNHVKPIGLFLKEIRSRGEISEEDAEKMHVILQKYAQSSRHEREQVDIRLRRLREQRGVHVFALDEQMLQRSIELAQQDLRLDPFDLSILAAILVVGERLRKSGATSVSFCEIDSDLQPWTKNAGLKQPLTSFYDDAGVWVYEDYLLERPPRPASWPSGGR